MDSTLNTKPYESVPETICSNATPYLRTFHHQNLSPMRIQLFSKNADNSKKPKVPIQPAANLPSTSSPSTSALPNANSLPPKFSVPPVLHPTPFKSIEISVAPDGVIVHPVAEGKNKPPSGIIIRWGVRGAIDEVALDENLIPGPTVFGILGILRLFQSMSVGHPPLVVEHTFHLIR